MTLFVSNGNACILRDWQEDAWVGVVFTRYAGPGLPEFAGWHIQRDSDQFEYGPSFEFMLEQLEEACHSRNTFMNKPVPLRDSNRAILQTQYGHMGVGVVGGVLKWAVGNDLTDEQIEAVLAERMRCPERPDLAPGDDLPSIFTGTDAN